jgi:hypothetical protein
MVSEVTLISAMLVSFVIQFIDANAHIHAILSHPGTTSDSSPGICTTTIGRIQAFTHELAHK